MKLLITLSVHIEALLLTFMIIRKSRTLTYCFLYTDHCNLIMLLFRSSNAAQFYRYLHSHWSWKVVNLIRLLHLVFKRIPENKSLTNSVASLHGKSLNATFKQLKYACFNIYIEMLAMLMIVCAILRLSYA